jgi:long-chain acyl-CoA synthetase
MVTGEPVPVGKFSTLSELFVNAVERHSKADAFLSKSGGHYRGLGSAEALRQAAALARALDRLGLKRGDRLAIIGENRVEWALADYACLGLGVIVVPVYPTLREPDVASILNDSGSRAVVASTAEQLQKVLNIRSQLPELQLILSMDPLPPSVSDAHDWNRLVASELAAGSDPVPFFRARAAQIQPGDTATILYTSGTTGHFKGVVLTHANIVANIRASAGLFPLAHHDVAISFLPLSHIFERMLDYVYFWQGVSIAYAESFETLPQNIREVRPTIMAVVPRVLEKIHGKITETVEQSSLARRKLFRWAVRTGETYFPYRLEGRTPPLGLRLRHALAEALVASKIRARLGGRIAVLISGSAPLSRELADFFYAVGLPVYEGYGLTETSPVISVNYPGAVKLGTVGRVIPGVEVKLGDEVIDEEGRAGREILVRGPNVTPGYYHREEENRQAFVDGWFRTGDLGTLDADGFLAITGRKKNIFKTSGGKFVCPERIENLFQGHPYVSQILVIGEGRRFVSAIVVPNFSRLEAYAREQHIVFTSREELVTDPEVLAFIGKQIDQATAWLPPHEQIRQIVLSPREFTVASGELSPTQKIKRHVVEANFRDAIEALYERRVHTQKA